MYMLIYKIYKSKKYFVTNRSSGELKHRPIVNSFMYKTKIAPEKMLSLKIFLDLTVGGRLEIPDEIHGAPCESGSECGEQQAVAFLQLGLVFVKAQGN